MLKIQCLSNVQQNRIYNGNVTVVIFPGFERCLPHNLFSPPFRTVIILKRRGFLGCSARPIEMVTFHRTQKNRWGLPTCVAHTVCNRGTCTYTFGTRWCTLFKPVGVPDKRWFNDPPTQVHSSTRSLRRGPRHHQTVDIFAYVVPCCRNKTWLSIRLVFVDLFCRIASVI